jgi:hypothetical protein
MYLGFQFDKKLRKNSSVRLFFLHVHCLDNRFSRSCGGRQIIMSFRLFSSCLIFQQQGLKVGKVIIIRSITIYSVGRLQYLTLVSFSAQKFAQPWCCYLRTMFKKYKGEVAAVVWYSHKFDTNGVMVGMVVPEICLSVWKLELWRYVDYKGKRGAAMTAKECERAAFWNSCAHWDVGVNVRPEKNILIRLKDICRMRDIFHKQARKFT